MHLGGAAVRIQTLGLRAIPFVKEWLTAPRRGYNYQFVFLSGLAILGPFLPRIYLWHKAVALLLSSAAPFRFRIFPAMISPNRPDPLFGDDTPERFFELFMAEGEAKLRQVTFNRCPKT